MSDINSEFTTLGWVPIQYMFYPLTREELIAYYRAADVILVTPVKDGMNLVVKEYIASNVDEKGVVILSEFAGAAYQLQENAVLINPYDIEGLTNAIHFSLMMPEKEREMRMKLMRKEVEVNDSFQWIEWIIDAVMSKA